MNESLVKYLAGLLDADGSLSFSFKEENGNTYIGLSLHLASSKAVDTLNWIDTLPEITGMGTISYYGKEQQFKTWAVNKRADLEMLLPRLTKHMVIKAQHWQWLLETWRNLRTDRTTVSVEERMFLTELSKESRKNRVGPLKPKNHPTWAWLAGYLDGDGWYSCRKHFDKNTGYTQWIIQTGAAAHINDASVLDFIERSFGGNISDHNKEGTVKVWKRSLGKSNSSFALSFLPNLAKHSRLKRNKIDAIIHNHRQRLSVLGPTG